MFDFMIAIVLWNILENFLIMMWYYDCLLVVSYGWRRNPAPVDMVSISFSTVVYTSQVVSRRISSINNIIQLIFEVPVEGVTGSIYSPNWQ